MPSNAFYIGQTDYIDKLNELATVNELLGITTGLENLESSVAAAAASAPGPSPRPSAHRHRRGRRRCRSAAG